MNQEAVTDMVLQEEMVETSAQEKAEMGSSEELAETGDIQIRENFAETAFFYPQLRTNETGEVSISFVLPESLTRWKFMGLAHTQNVDYGKIELPLLPARNLCFNLICPVLSAWEIKRILPLH